jgi:hypothetical protein
LFAFHLPHCVCAASAFFHPLASYRIKNLYLSPICVEWSSSSSSRRRSLLYNT